MLIITYIVYVQHVTVLQTVLQHCFIFICVDILLLILHYITNCVVMHLQYMLLSYLSQLHQINTTIHTDYSVYSYIMVVHNIGYYYTLHNKTDTHMVLCG